MSKINFIDLKAQYNTYKKEIDTAVLGVLDSGQYIMGPEITKLEKTLAGYTGSKHAITCASGTDALLLAMMAINIKPGDEIITTPFTFIATTETIALLGAIPVFVDIDEKTYNIAASLIEEKITTRTKAIIPVGLYGQCSDMEEINNIAKKHNLKVIEDAAQSFGAEYKGQRSCNLSDIGCTSFFPSKPLGCYGDGGAIFTNDDDLAEKMKSLRVHGQIERYHHKYVGINGRMDAIQAAVVSVKMKYFDNEVKKRIEIGNRYSQLLKGCDVITPFVRDDRTSVFAQYSVRVKGREKVIDKLKEKDIPTAVHYPKPLHLQEAFSYLSYKDGEFPVSEKVSREIMSLPMSPFLKIEQQTFIINALNSIF